MPPRKDERSCFCFDLFHAFSVEPTFLFNSLFSTLLLSVTTQKVANKMFLFVIFLISSLIVAFRKISWFICSPFLCRQESSKEARPTSFSANSCLEFSEMEKAPFQEFRSNSWDIYVKGKVSHNSDIFIYV